MSLLIEGIESITQASSLDLRKRRSGRRVGHTWPKC